MKTPCRIFGISAAAVALAMATLMPAALAAGKPETLTGEVSDSMCGAKHMMEGSAAECTRACVRKGSKYALVVGDKLYALESNDKTVLDQLDKLAGNQARVTGTVNSDTVAVKSVGPAGK
jgi:hypothetical protein